jgi:hypothetical protein
MNKHNTLSKKLKTKSLISRCMCINNIPYFISSAGILIMIIGGIILYKKFYNVKIELDSCRSSRSNMSI